MKRTPLNVAVVVAALLTLVCLTVSFFVGRQDICEEIVGSTLPAPGVSPEALAAARAIEKQIGRGSCGGHPFRPRIVRTFTRTIQGKRTSTLETVRTEVLPDDSDPWLYAAIGLGALGALLSAISRRSLG